MFSPTSGVKALFDGANTVPLFVRLMSSLSEPPLRRSQVEKRPRRSAFDGASMYSWSLV